MEASWRPYYICMISSIEKINWIRTKCFNFFVDVKWWKDFLLIIDLLTVFVGPTSFWDLRQRRECCFECWILNFWCLLHCIHRLFSDKTYYKNLKRFWKDDESGLSVKKQTITTYFVTFKRDFRKKNLFGFKLNLYTIELQFHTNVSTLT